MWYLEGFTDKSHHAWRTPLDPLPFRLGRSPGCQLHLGSPSVSQRHAEIFSWGDELRIVDLGSTNGTFVNSGKIETAQTLQEGDIVRLADWEFRVVALPRGAVPAATTTPLAPSLEGDSELARKFQAMVGSDSVWAVFQPIVRLTDRRVVGYEALGRGLLDGVETPADSLFAIAEVSGKEVELSELFRSQQLEDAGQLPGDPEIFLNTHPAELRSERTLVESLTNWRVSHGFLPRLCIEIHEAAAIDLGLLGGLRKMLDSIDANVAFDDFGTGQPRLFELAEISPRYVKFDRGWVRDLDRASARRAELVSTLTDMVLGLGITPIAEGVERCEEAEACVDLGFELAQGFYLGRPARASAF